MLASLLSLLLLLQSGAVYYSIVTAQAQSSCATATIGSSEILASQTFDADGDGKLDEAVIYGREDLNVLVVSDAFAPTCRVVLNAYLTYRSLQDGKQVVTIRAFELVQLSGDAQPELHIWLEKRGGVRRQQIALHRIFARQQGQWNEVMVAGLCLDSDKFEIRDGGQDGAKAIYLEDDYRCDGFSYASPRTFTYMRWNGTRFMPAERGTVEAPLEARIESWLTFGLILGICLAPFLVVGLVAAGSGFFAFKILKGNKTL